MSKQRQWSTEEIAADPEFPHGENRGYSRGCKCDRCRQAHLTLQRGFRATVKRGRRLRDDDLVPAGKVHAHLDRLVAAGHTLGTVARVAGLNVSTLHKTRQRKTVTVRTARAVLAVTPEQVLRLAPPTALVSSRRPVQQVRSMQALGYTGAWIADRLGYAGQSALAFVSQGRPHITADLALRVDALAREVGYTWGPSALSRSRAARAGWYGPACYDEYGTLLPGAQPLVDVA